MWFFLVPLLAIIVSGISGVVLTIILPWPYTLFGVAIVAYAGFALYRAIQYMEDGFR